ncbi:MAG: glycosyltransferase family 2 protein [bacterium]
MPRTFKEGPISLTVVIPVRNEGKGLARCLTSLGDDLASRIVVLDSGSSDDTVEVATRQGAEVITFCWDGHFPKKRNWFLRNHTPSTEWVLFLDADELLTPEFKKELRDRLPGSRDSGFWLRYSIHFMGKALRHGYPLKKLALFRVGSGEYERIEEDSWSHLDMEVHEHPVIRGSVGEIKATIDHCDDRGIGDYVLKHEAYASWEAKRILMADSDGAQTASWTWKQVLKRRIILSPLAGPLYFLGAYLLMGGFLDGARGLEFAILKASYFTQVACKVRELSNVNHSSCQRNKQDSST